MNNEGLEVVETMIFLDRYFERLLTHELNEEKKLVSVNENRTLHIFYHDDNGTAKILIFFE